MDDLLKRSFRRFSENPIFFLEVSRIFSGISKCVLVQQVYKVPIEVNDKISMALNDFVEGKIGVKDLFSVTFECEKTLENFCKNTYGLEVQVTPYVGFVSRVLSKPVLTPEYLFFVGDFDRAELRQIEKKLLSGKISFERAQKKLIEKEGKLLGYPRCCIKSYEESKRTIPAESKIILEMFEKKLFDKLFASLESSRIEPVYSLFTSNFYPCSIDCDKAVSLGLSLDSWLDEYSHAFRLRTMVNALYVFNTAVVASKTNTEFGKKLRSFLCSYSKWVTFCESISDKIKKITEFSNLFINRIIFNLNYEILSKS